MRLTVEQINELLDGLAKLRQEIDRLKKERDTAYAKGFKDGRASRLFRDV